VDACHDGIAGDGMSAVLDRLALLGLELPPSLGKPRSRMRRLVRAGDTVWLSGNGPFMGSELLYRGKVGGGLTLAQGVEAARLTALNQVRVLLDHDIDLDRVRWVKVLGMVNSDPSFVEQAAVVNGFSETIADLFGEENGLPARSACGMASMPWDMAVEVEAVCLLLPSSADRDAPTT
jgi:enamine deaminase RidA (YjgF/YER057c/UK114 family)